MIEKGFDTFLAIGLRKTFSYEGGCYSPPFLKKHINFIIFDKDILSSILKQF
jgi:hypothetical protein